MKKMITSLFLVSTIFTSSIFTSISSADSTSNNESSKVGKINFQLVNDNLNNYEYTYEEDGVFYRIVENIDLEKNDVSSDIYVKENGQYVLDSEVSSKLLEDNSLLISTTKDGIITNETIPTSSIISEDPQTGINKVEGLNNPIENRISAASSDLTDWTFHSITRGSSLSERLTIGAITIVISALTPLAAVKIVTQIANLYYQLNKTNIYWQKQWYYRHTLTNPPLPRAERIFTYFYTDSSYNNYIYDSPVMEESYTPGWGP